MTERQDWKGDFSLYNFVSSESCIHCIWMKRKKRRRKTRKTGLPLTASSQVYALSFISYILFGHLWFCLPRFHSHLSGNRLYPYFSVYMVGGLEECPNLGHRDPDPGFLQQWLLRGCFSSYIYWGIRYNDGATEGHLAINNGRVRLQMKPTQKKAEQKAERSGSSCIWHSLEIPCVPLFA